MSKFKSEEANYINDGIKEVIIPKGLINPNETTIIEIPEKMMENVRTVVARPRSIPASSSAVLSVHNPQEKFEKPPIKRDQQFCFNTTQMSISNNKLKPKSSSKSKVCDGNSDVKYKFAQKHRLSTKIPHEDQERVYNTKEFYEAQTSHYPYYEDTKDLEYPKNPEDFESVLRKQAFSMYQQAPDEQIYNEIEQSKRYLNDNYAPPHNSGPHICQYCNKHKKTIKNRTHAQIEAVLSNLEALEFKRIQNDLINFQNARRKIIFEATGFQMGPPPKFQ